ncbi:hypothetical protein NONO_c37700 [Nocardia nova SH22a]|uniref:Uncharacterized protein n=1 Tax=Nocardia nova SH22a TaxID=1415166 RepID=W5THB7_9NOCA|nr:hypothetical protein NONO_c37700 [Nocardia nova SH22a]
MGVNVPPKAEKRLGFRQVDLLTTNGAVAQAFSGVHVPFDL